MSVVIGYMLPPTRLKVPIDTHANTTRGGYAVLCLASSLLTAPPAHHCNTFTPPSQPIIASTLHPNAPSPQPQPHVSQLLTSYPHPSPLPSSTAAPLHYTPHTHPLTPPVLPQVVIFVKSVQRCVALATLLVDMNFPAIAIHRAMQQEERLSRYQQFKDFQKVRNGETQHSILCFRSGTLWDQFLRSLPRVTTLPNQYWSPGFCSIVFGVLVWVKKFTETIGKYH